MACVLTAVLIALGSTAEEPQFEHLAEGYTSTARTSGIEAGYRMFTVPWSRENCPGFPRATKLLLSGAPPQLTVGKWFPYDRLAIVALDSSGNLLPPIPILIEVELVHPPVLNLQNDMLAEPASASPPRGSVSLSGFHLLPGTAYHPDISRPRGEAMNAGTPNQARRRPCLTCTYVRTYSDDGGVRVRPHDGRSQRGEARCRLRRRCGGSRGSARTHYSRPVQR